MPTFSFIIPVKPGGTVSAIDALRQLTADPACYEILIAEGSRPSLQRNGAVQQARGEVIYFLDDDSRVAPDCLAVCTALFSDDSVAVVGGPSLTPQDNTPLQRLFGLALSSLFGAGGMRNRYRTTGDVRETTDKELILCNLAIRRDVFLEAGGLDERLYPNEENELLDRLLASGRKLIHAPQIAVHRSQRSTLRQFVRQMFSYGRGRAQQTLIAGGGTFIGFIPLLFLIYLLLLPFTCFQPLFLCPLYAYMVLSCLSAAAAVISSGSLNAILLSLLFPVMHISNGIGLLVGLTGGKKGVSPSPGSSEIYIRHVKEFSQTDW